MQPAMVTAMRLVVAVAWVWRAAGQESVCARLLTDKSGHKKRHIMTAQQDHQGKWNHAHYMAHVVVTRLGLHSSPELAEVELEALKRVTLKSLRGQSEQRYEWFVYAPASTPARVLEPFADRMDADPNFHLVAVDREACALERRRTPEVWPLQDQLELIGQWKGLIARDRENLLTMTTRLDPGDALPLDGIAHLRLLAAHVPKTFTEEASQVRVVCWERFLSREATFKSGVDGTGAVREDVVERQVGPEACVRAGLTQVLQSSAILRSKGSVYRFFPPKVRNRAAKGCEGGQLQRLISRSFSTRFG